MQRYSISLDGDLAEWVETQADERGVSKAKVIRDAVAAARDRGTSMPQSREVIERLEDLEARVAALEVREETASEDSAAAGVESDDITEARSSGHATDIKMESTDADDLVEEIATFLEDRPPQTDQGKAAVLTTFKRLRDRGEAQTGELQEYVFDYHSEGYTSAKSLWQSIQRHLEDVPGIEKAGYGTWAYAGDDVARAELDE